MTVPMITNLASFKRTVANLKEQVKGTATSRYQNFVTAVLTDLAKNTPQWSGDLAASWQVVVGRGSTPDARNMFIKSVPYERPAPHSKGDMEAVNVALNFNREAIGSIRWNSIVSLANSNRTVGEIRVKGGDAWLRPANRPSIPGDIMAVAFVAHKYSTKRQYGDLNLGTGG